MQPRELVILAIVQAVLAGLASIGVLVFLALCKPLRKSKRLEDRIFKVLCLAVFAQGVLSVVSALERGLIFIPYQNFFGYALMFLPDLVFVLVVLIWLMFVDAAVNKSPDCIKRRFKYAHYPYIVMGGLLLLGYSLTWKVYDEMDTLGEASEFTMMFFRIWRESYYYIALAIIIVYLIAAFRTVHYYQREFKQPLFLRLDVFIIPWIVAFIVQNVPPYLVIDIPCALISLILTYYSMRSRYYYIDDETDFYKEEYIPFLQKTAEMHHFKIDCGMACISCSDIEKGAEILHMNVPDKCIVIRMDVDCFLMLAQIKQETAFKLFDRNLKETADHYFPGVEISSSFWPQQENETLSELSRRAIREMIMATA